VGTFFRELMHVGIYKRSQGRITRQVTFAALAVAIVLGLWRLSTALVGWDPIVKAQPALVTCTTKTGRVEADAKIKVTGTAGSATIAVQAGDRLAKVAEAIDARRKATGVAAVMTENKLVLSSEAKDATGSVQLDAPPGTFQTEGLGTGDIARGRNSLNLGLRYLIPGLLLALGVWASYRVVNVPAFADFLIAVEAEMNKVSWPTRSELFRASMVVLILIVVFAFILAGFDLAWGWLFRNVLHIL
jgi:preprotein translocase SecE subunit